MHRKCHGERLSRIWAAAAFALMLLAGGPVAADSWLPPTVQAYHSPDQRFRFTVTPRGIKDPLSYFEDKGDGREPAGQNPNGQPKARGRLQRFNGQGEWVTVWDQPLVNDVAPVSALVANSGGYVVTFDNWHSAGYGDDVVVIYAPDGGKVRAFGLIDFLPEAYVGALPRTVSSLWWGGKHRVLGHVLILKVVVPDDEEDAARSRYVEIRIDLATGAVTPPSGADWDAALADVAKVNVRLARQRAEWVAEMRRPLEAPSSPEELGWTRYMFEAFRRVAPDWDKEPPQTLFLPSLSAADYDDALDSLVGILEESETENGGLNFMAASPDQANMTAVLVTAAPRLVGKLKGKRLYILVGDSHWPVLQTALASTGAELIQIDPATPIPQRSERLSE